MGGDSTAGLVRRLSPVGRVPEDVRGAAAQSRRFVEDSAGNAVRYVILDCSGTVMDKYVDAPATVFVEVFKRFGVQISMAEARAPMGLRKDLHIKALTEMPSVRDKWRAAHGRDPNAQDVADMFSLFVPMQLDLLKRGNYSDLLPDVAEVCRGLQSRGAKIGVTTGFTRDMLDILLEGGRRQGFVPDTSVAGDEVETPRPLPYMVIKNLERMGVGNLQNAMRLTVKVDDTVSGAGEGAPMCWRVGVSKWSNYVVDSCQQAQLLSPADLREREVAAKEKLVRESGAHYVIDDLRNLPAVIEDINARLERGENP
jgi:phosphonoacetaldehyde hydrolase